jgi:hypothetical protein
MEQIRKESAKDGKESRTMSSGPQPRMLCVRGNSEAYRRMLRLRHDWSECTEC